MIAFTCSLTFLALLVRVMRVRRCLAIVSVARQESGDSHFFRAVRASVDGFDEVLGDLSIWMHDYHQEEFLGAIEAFYDLPRQHKLEEPVARRIF